MKFLMVYPIMTMNIINKNHEDSHSFKEWIQIIEKNSHTDILIIKNQKTLSLKTGCIYFCSWLTN